MIRASILMCALAVAIPAAARPQEDESKAVLHKLRTIRLDVDFKNDDLRSVIDYIREVSDVNFVISSLKHFKGSFTMKVKGVTIQSILNLLLKPQGIGFAIDGGVVIIAAEAELRPLVRLEIIDVRDVMFPIRDFPGVEITLTADSAGATFSAAADDTPPEFPIVDLIKAHTGGKAWDENANTSIQLNNGLLFVRHTPEMIAQIRKLVGYLRQYK